MKKRMSFDVRLSPPERHEPPRVWVTLLRIPVWLAVAVAFGVWFL